MSDDVDAIHAEEVARVNAERGTNLTVEGMLRGVPKEGAKDLKGLAKFMGRNLLLGALLFFAGLMFFIAVVIEGGAGTRAVLIVIGVVLLGLSFFPFRAEYRVIRDWVREDRAIDEVNRRVAARLSGRDGGQPG